MRRFFMIAALIMLFGVCSNVVAQDGDRNRIAVFDPASSGTSIDEGTKIAVREIISSTIVNTGKYSIVERSLLEKVMEEQKFSNSGAVDDMQATEIGKLAGANKVVLSVVTLTGGRNMLSIKIIDVMTATIERQKVKVVTSGELLDVIESLTLEMLNIQSAYSASVVNQQSSATVVNQQKKGNFFQKLQTAFSKSDDSQPTTNSEPQQNNIADVPQYVPAGEMFMYGVDFSHVQIYKAKETFFASFSNSLNKTFPLYLRLIASRINTESAFNTSTVTCLLPSSGANAFIISNS